MVNNKKIKLIDTQARIFWLNNRLNQLVKRMDNEKDSTQAKILLAAKQVFLAKGMAGARMQDIADEAGINKALLHYYFRSKEKLFEVIFSEALEQFFPKIVDIIESDMSLFEKIEKFCSQYIAMMRENAYLPLFVLNEVNKQPEYFKERFWKNKDSLFMKFGLQVESEIKQGKIKKISPAHLFINMISMCIFPFIAKPLWLMSTGMDETGFGNFMEQRKTEIPKFIIESIKK
jgi:TetR/AcrR family transcriptional regulator